MGRTWVPETKGNGMSKIRIIWKQSQSVFPGSAAIRQLGAIAKSVGIYVPPVTPQWKYAVALEKAVRGARFVGPESQLMIYREPRNVNPKNSRYRAALRTLPGFERPPRPGRATRPRRPPQPHGHPKPKRPSRTVSLLEQEILRKGDDF